MNKNFTVGGLFSGVGGIELGFKQAGFEIAWSNEIDKYACKTYIENFPNHKLFPKCIEDYLSKDKNYKQYYNKNIRSTGNNHLLGAWIKGKMEQHGALMRLHPFNLDVLENYGKDSIKFYKISEGNFYIQF